MGYPTMIDNMYMSIYMYILNVNECVWMFLVSFCYILFSGKPLVSFVLVGDPISFEIKYA